MGQTLKNNKGKILTTTAIGAGLGAALFSDKVKDIVTGGNGSTSSDTASADTSSTDSSTDSSNTKGNEDNKPPKTSKTKTRRKDSLVVRTTVVITTKLGRRPRYDVALQSYRNPSQPLRNGFEMVADYLISEGHADTVEEARYVINQMEVDDITEILNEVIQ